MKKHALALSLFLTCNAGMATAESLVSTSPDNAKVYFIQPSDGQTVSKDVKIIFGLQNMGIAPAGIEKANTGHHHLLIDTDTLPDLSQPLPASDKLKHFGAGQTETILNLEPGEHTLQLVLGNHLHIPHAKPVISEKITIKVE